MTWLSKLRAVFGERTPGRIVAEKYRCKCCSCVKVEGASEDLLYVSSDKPCLAPGDAMFYATAANLSDAMLDVCEAADKASKEIERFYLNMRQESHVQTIREDDHDIWFARDELDKALEALRELAEKEIGE